MVKVVPALMIISSDLTDRVGFWVDILPAALIGKMDHDVLRMLSSAPCETASALKTQTHTYTH